MAIAAQVGLVSTASGQKAPHQPDGGDGAGFGEIRPGQQGIGFAQGPGDQLNGLGLVALGVFLVQVPGQVDVGDMLNVTRCQRNGLKMVDAPRGEADLFLQLAVGRVRRVLLGVYHPLGESEFVAVEAGGVFARQQQRIALEGDHHDRSPGTEDAFVLAALAVGELQIEGFDLEDTRPCGDMAGQDAGFGLHTQVFMPETRLLVSKDPRERVCCHFVTAAGGVTLKMIDWNHIDKVFLDMDGTLLDLHFDNRFWREHVPVRFAAARGVDLERARAQLLELYRDREGTLEWYCIDHWSRELGLDIALLKEEIDHLIAVHPRVLEFLEALAERGLRRVLVTNAHQKAIALKMRKTRLVGHLERIICAHDLGLPKENPGFWPRLQAIEPFDPERTLFIDDTLEVLDTARAFGFRHLLHVLAPDSQASPRPRGDYMAIHGFGELMPVLGAHSAHQVSADAGALPS